MIMNHPFVILALALVGLYATSAHHKVYSPVFCSCCSHAPVSLSSLDCFPSLSLGLLVVSLECLLIVNFWIIQLLPLMLYAL